MSNREEAVNPAAMIIMMVLIIEVVMSNL